MYTDCKIGVGIGLDLMEIVLWGGGQSSKMLVCNAVCSP